MKKLNYNIIALGAVILLTVTYSCKKFLTVSPTGVLNAQSLSTKAGVDGLLIGAYSLLDGYYQNQPYTNYGSGISNWSFGGIGSDESYKGSTTNDQAPDAPAVEQHITIATTNAYVESKWQVTYAGVERANNVLQALPGVTDGSETATEVLQIGSGSVTESIGAETAGEAKFLRGVYHFEAAKVWGKVPYVDETVTYVAGNYNVGNPGFIWTQIENDFKAAMAVLPNTQAQAGRANYYAAEAFLAKAYCYDHKYALAIPLLTDCINNGVTASGQKYALGLYQSNFNALLRNGPEAVFSAQFTVNDGSNGQNDDGGDILNFPGGGTYTGCCGFYIPSYNLANAFKVDANGLPMFQIDQSTGFPTYNDTFLPNDYGPNPNSPAPPATYVPLTPELDAAYVPTNAPIDPRLDWTVGRNGIPYLDWGLCGGWGWTRGDYEAYTPKKHSFYEAQAGSTTDASIWGATGQGSAANYNIMRFADVILLRAEAEAATGALAAAEADVNLVRARAQNPTSWVYQYTNNANPQGGYSTTAAANYQVGLYSGQFAANGQTYALNAVLMERQIEFGQEGQRFFDLQRMDGATGGPLGAGFMAGVMNAYYKSDVRISNPVLNLAKFTQGRDEFYPIPQQEIDEEGGTLKQNPGY